MEALVGLILGFIGVFAYTKYSDSKDNTTLATTKLKDEQLQASQTDIEQSLKALDDGITKMKTGQVARDTSIQNESLQQAAENLKKGLK